MKKLLIKNAYIATLSPKNEKFEHGDLYIEGPEIKDIGVNLDYSADRIIDATDKLVLPGFVNTHHHFFQTLCRNIPRVQDAKLFDWLINLYEIWRELTPDAVYVSTLVALGELLLTGCTTSTDLFYVFPEKAPRDLIDSQVESAKEIGSRFHLCRGSMSCGRTKGGLPPDDVTQTEDEILSDSQRVIEKFHDTGKFSMCQVALAPCSPFSVTTDLLKETIKLARLKGVKCHTHVAETLDEEEYCLKLYNKRPLAYMESVGWLGSDVWFAHAIHLNSDEVKLMGQTQTGVAHCPTSNMRLGSGIAPVPEMLKAGVPVGLAVDGSASNDSSDMLGELRNCLLLHRVKGGANAITAEEVFQMATSGGAKILGRETEIGSLEIGKAADIAIFNLNQLGFAGSLHDPLAAVIFSGDSHITDMTIVNGEIVVENGRLTRVDEEKLIKQANKIAKEMIEKAQLKTKIDFYKK